MMRAPFAITAAILAASLALVLGAGAQPSGLREELLAIPVTVNLGGDTTRVVASDKAYTFLAANAPPERQRAFLFGNRLFNANWAEFPASVKAFDGLGPTFNRNSCSGCHVRDGRGQPPQSADAPMDSMLVRISVPGSNAPHPVYGDQLNDRAIPGVKPEGRAGIAYDELPGEYGDGKPYTLLKPKLNFVEANYGPLTGVLTSPRVAPAVVGLGLLEAVPVATLEALADPDDANGDGISGRINRVTNHAGRPAVGRFGWKANVATLAEQAAGAAIGDIGITTSLFPDQNCSTEQADCIGAMGEHEPEMSDSFLERLVVYIQTLAVPQARPRDERAFRDGLATFTTMGCVGCHVPTLQTDGTSVLPELRNQTFHPFTDLLLHDMGDGLADHRPDGSATGTEWRTPPLWGLGLTETVNGHDRLLHDGRARGFAEAILWHGGEAEAAAEAFRTAPENERIALIEFLRSL
jgi:CxxC motif-containing protein (DUF1111 family)